MINKILCSPISQELLNVKQKSFPNKINKKQISEFLQNFTEINTILDNTNSTEQAADIVYDKYTEEEFFEILFTINQIFYNHDNLFKKLHIDKNLITFSYKLNLFTETDITVHRTPRYICTYKYSPEFNHVINNQLLIELFLDYYIKRVSKNTLPLYDKNPFQTQSQIIVCDVLNNSYIKKSTKPLIKVLDTFFQENINLKQELEQKLEEQQNKNMLKRAEEITELFFEELGEKLNNFYDENEETI